MHASEKTTPPRDSELFFYIGKYPLEVCHVMKMYLHLGQTACMHACTHCLPLLHTGCNVPVKISKPIYSLISQAILQGALIGNKVVTYYTL